MTTGIDDDTDLLVKTVRVPQAPVDAWRLFVDEIGAWWPLATHSVGRDDAVRVSIETAIGGEVVETMADGTTAVWGTVTVFEPPRRVAFTWHPGTPVAEATHVEVTFEPDPEPGVDGTVVVLRHRGWAARPDGAAARRDYAPGWDLVLGRLVGHAGG